MTPSPLLWHGLEQVRSKWGWFVGLGVLLALVGMFAIQQSFAATIASMIVFGGLLIIAGVAELSFAFTMRGWGGFLLHVLGAALDFVVGYMFIAEPLKGAEVLTVFLAAMFFVSGIFRIAASIAARYPGWVWSLVSGVINVVLAVLLLKQWPVSGLWFIGFCVGLELIFRGWFWMMLGFTLKNSPTQPAMK